LDRVALDRAARGLVLRPALRPAQRDRARRMRHCNRPPWAGWPRRRRAVPLPRERDRRRAVLVAEVLVLLAVAAVLACPALVGPALVGPALACPAVMLPVGLVLVLLRQDGHSLARAGRANRPMIPGSPRPNPPNPRSTARTPPSPRNL